MFNNKISEYNKNKLTQLAERFCEATIERSTDPENYYNNIQCLREFAKVAHDWLDIVKPYIKNEQLDVVERSKKYILTPKTHEITIREFAKEPRIKRLDATEYLKEKTTHDNVENIDYQTTKSKMVCKILFSDDTEIVFKHIDDLDEIEANKTFFDSKMEELLPQNGYNLAFC